MMMKEFRQDGISFRYPSAWKREQEDAEHGWTVLLQSPQTAFLTVTLDEEMPSIEEMAEAALQAMRSEYPQLEAEARLDKVAGLMAIGHDINFFSFDLTVTCWTRCLYAGTGTLLLMFQSSDFDLETAKPALDAICVSLSVAEEEMNDDSDQPN